VVVDYGGAEPRSEAEFDYDRTVALSDGVFAIALTLLVLTITLPDLEGAAKHQLADRLSGQLPQLLSYAISFGVLGLLWVRHHALFRTLTRINWTLTVLNLAYLALVAFLPYPTSLIGRYGDQSVSVVIYAITLVLITLLSAAMRVYTNRAGITAPDAPHESLRRYFVVSGTFLASIPVALLIDPSAGLWMWTALLLEAVRSRLRRKTPSSG
jgi:uncharacterized membrane protein